MAGRDASVNLGGMLNQIGQTVGSMDKAFNPVLNAAMKPRGDMNDPAHLMRLAEWARSTGDQQSAAQYMQQSQMMSAKLEKERAAAIQQAKVGMVNEYAKASKDPSGNNQAAYDALMEFSTNAGVDVQREIAGIDAQAESARQAERRAAQENEAKAEEGFKQALNAKMGGTDDLSKLVDTAPPQYRDLARVLVTREMQFREAREAQASKVTDLKTPVSTDLASSSIKEIQNPEAKAAFEERLKKLEAESGWDEEAGEWNTIVDKRNYAKRVAALENEAFRMATDEAVQAGRALRFAEQDKADAIAAARKNKVTEAELTAWAEANDKDIVSSDDLGTGYFEKNNVTRAQAISAVIQERIAGIEGSDGEVIDLDAE